MMYKVIGGDQQEYGPATADEIRAWIADGRLSFDSKVKELDPRSAASQDDSADAAQAGQGDWRHLSDFPEFSEALRNQVERFAKPGEIPPFPQIEPARASIRSSAPAPELHVGRCLSLGWELMLSNFGLIFGSTFLVWMIGMICQVLPLGIFYWLVSSVFYGGLFLVILQRMRGQEVSVGDTFLGFRMGFSQLMLAGLVSGLLSWLGLFLCVLPGLYLYIAWIFSVPLVADRRLEFWSAMELSRRTVSRVWFKVFALALVAFLPLVLIHGYLEIKISSELYGTLREMMTPGSFDLNKLLEAMKQVAASTVPLILISKLVLLLNLPFGLCVLMCAYEDLFGSRPTRTP